MKIVLTDCQTITDGDLSLQPLSQFGKLVCHPLTDYPQIAQRVQDADLVLCNKTPLNRETLKNAGKLQYIGLFATGYNNIDISYCEQQGITVCNAGSYSTNAVAQHTFAFILEHYSKVSRYSAFVNEGGWKKSRRFSPFVFPTQELYGKTLGLIGFGAIAKAVAKLARAFGMQVLAYTRTPKADPLVTFVDFDTLLKESDILSVHCPLNAQSQAMFNTQTFAKCKDGAYFINTARGAIVEEQALLDAVQSKKLSGAGIDVLDLEPMAETCKLFNVPRITVTPHVAWAPLETRKRLFAVAAENIRAFLNGTPQNMVTKKAF